DNLKEAANKPAFDKRTAKAHKGRALGDLSRAKPQKRRKPARWASDSASITSERSYHAASNSAVNIASGAKPSHLWQPRRARPKPAPQGQNRAQRKAHRDSFAAHPLRQTAILLARSADVP